MVATTGLPDAVDAQDTGAVPADSALLHLSQDWLELLDAGELQRSFDQAAPLLQQMAGSAEGWRNFLRQARPVPADSVRREMLGIEHDPDIPGAPPGRYVTVAFTTNLPELPAESVVLHETNEGWKVSMYMLRTPESLEE